MTAYQMIFNSIITILQPNCTTRAISVDCAFVREIPELGCNPTPGLGTLIIAEQGVLKQLSSLNPNKAYGPDQIPPWFLKTFAADIAPILNNIFQDSIDSGTVPPRWKEAKVCAVLKKGKKSDPANYRPILFGCTEDPRAYRPQLYYETSKRP